METVIKNIHLLAPLLSEEKLEMLTAGALQHRRFSRITFKVLSVDGETIKIQTVQDKSPQGNQADQTTLIERTKELFQRFLPLHHVIVNASVYRPSVTEAVTPEYVRHNMTELKIKVKDMVADTGIDKSNISAWMNGTRDMSQIVKAMFYYYFLSKQKTN